MLQHQPPTCHLRHIIFTNVDYINEKTKIGLSQINFEIINTPKIDNTGHDF